MKPRSRLLAGGFLARQILTLIFILLTFPAKAGFEKYKEVEKLEVGYYGKPDILHERLSLDPKIKLIQSPEVNELKGLDTIFIYDSVLESDLITAIRQKVESGESGLVINLGENITSEFLLTILGTDISLEHLDENEISSQTENHNYGEVIKWRGPDKHPLSKQIPWKSSVQVQERTQVIFREPPNGDISILASINQKPGHTSSEFSNGILLEKQLGQGKVYLLNPWFKKGNDEERLEHFWSVLLIKNEGAYNYTLYNWAYFNWLLNFLVYDAAGKNSSKFSSWPYSPIPDQQDNITLFFSLFFVLTISLFGFAVIRKQSLAHPEILDNIRISDYHEVKEQRLERLRNLIKNSNPILALPLKLQFRIAKLVYSEIANSSKQWEQIGFIRPLSGFQMVVSIIYISVLPILVFAAIMLNYVIPFPQSIGMTSWVAGAFSLLFTIFDLGTGIAMIKYFAEYRIKKPAKAMQYVQFYIWFQLISGIIQISLLSVATASLAPDSAYGFMTWIIIFKLLTQFPGFAAVFHNIFRALQRYDLMLLTWILPIPFAAAFSFFGMVWIRSWGLANPVYGEIMGLSLGNVVPAFVGSWIYILVSVFIFKALGFSLKATFSAHFDIQVVKKSLSFGLRYTPGAIAPMLSGFALPVILSLWLNNYLELNSLLTVALWINLVIRGPGYMLYSNLLPSISEAYSHKRYILSSHYIDQALKWSLMFLGGILPYFIVLGEDVAAAIMPEQWAAASQFIALAVIFGAIEFLSALPDESFKAVGKPQLFTVVNVLDHLLRIILMLVLIPEYKIQGVLYAYIISTSIRCVVSWIILSKFIIKLEVSWWQSIVTPAVVTAFIFIIAFGVKSLYQVSTPEEALPLVLIFFVISPVFYFITALFGGFDESTLKEFKKATDLNLVTRLLSWIPLVPARLGARVSPLHGKFPMKNWTIAQQEARELTEEKVSF